MHFLIAFFAADGAGVHGHICDTNRSDFEAAVHGKTAPRFEVLFEKNGSTLELHMPDGKPPVLASFPPEHLSHIAWTHSADPSWPGLDTFRRLARV